MWLTKTFVLICTVLAAVQFKYSHAVVETLDYLPQDLQSYFDTCRSTGDLTKNSPRIVFWLSVNQFCSNFVKSRPDLSPRQRNYLENSLREAIAPLYEEETGMLGKRKKRQLGVRTRMEVRAMNDNQRRRYFAAVNAMKLNPLLPPNVFDFLANYHTGPNLRAAHFGPAFLSWHRLYLWIFEFFLRREDSEATIPYWASEIDNEMTDNSQSTIWHSTLFGNGDGFPRNGEFVGWRNISETTAFTRDVTHGPLFNYEEIDRITSLERTANITFPLAAPENNLESAHGRPHIQTGGSMSGLTTAAFDPVFFSHHANVDKIYNDFQINQLQRGINPQLDYPFDRNDPRFRPEHSPDFNAGFAGLGGARSWTQRLGYSNVFRRLVRYAPRPSCQNRCGNSRYLYCDQRNRRCMSFTRAQFDARNPRTLGVRAKRAPIVNTSPALSYLPQDICPKRSFINDVDTRVMGSTTLLPNEYSNDWAFVAFNVVSKRSQDFHEFNKYSLHNKGTNANLGIKGEFLKPGQQYKYKNCDKYQDVVGKITVVAHGLNYDGRSKEVVFVDNRLGVSEAKGFIPIKRPTAGNPSEVILSAFDSCGRVCKPFCKSTSNGAMGKYFHGGIKVSTTAPKQYAYSYADAQLDIWDAPTQSSCPKVNYNNIPISFFCEYRDTWIWGESSTMPGMGRDMIGQTGAGQGSHMGNWQGSNIGTLESHQGGVGQGHVPLTDHWRESFVGTGQSAHTSEWQGSQVNTSQRRGIRPQRRGGRRGGRRRTGNSGRHILRPSTHQNISPFGGSIDIALPSSGRYIGRTA